MKPGRARSQREEPYNVPWQGKEQNEEGAQCAQSEQEDRERSDSMCPGSARSQGEERLNVHWQ